MWKLVDRTMFALKCGRVRYAPRRVQDNDDVSETILVIDNLLGQMDEGQTVESYR